MTRRGAQYAAGDRARVPRIRLSANVLSASLLTCQVRSCAEQKDGDGWRGKCFHLLGIDVMLDRRGKAHLLEVNCNPSLGVDSVYCTEGPYAQAVPPPPPATASLVERAMPLMKGRGVKVCKCRSHHR